MSPIWSGKPGRVRPLLSSTYRKPCVGVEGGGTGARAVKERVETDGWPACLMGGLPRCGEVHQAGRVGAPAPALLPGSIAELANHAVQHGSPWRFPG